MGRLLHQPSCAHLSHHACRTEASRGAGHELRADARGHFARARSRERAMSPFRFGRRRQIDELSEEIEAHLAEKTDALVASGMSAHDAEREAMRSFGNVTRVREAAGDVWRLETALEGLSRDLRYALRSLIRNP